MTAAVAAGLSHGPHAQSGSRGGWVSNLRAGVALEVHIYIVNMIKIAHPCTAVDGIERNMLEQHKTQKTKHTSLLWSEC